MDLDRVWSEVFEASKDYDIAAQYVNELMDKVEAKAEHPKSGAPLYYEDSFTGYYFVVFKSYLAFYRLENGVILVDRILFGRSDYLKVLRLK
ncbi:MAG TPA: type II toxin-antitoxin system RelE/ParE family toxin [Candidatus Limivivens intestinipullorum]|uniref:Type II toxin-antitoxin system RelE/ParE family toxin n=1 Tax=Candidatus Limivivens intestinipullorum TaxID=2840858 RepID=A0A9D1JK42_9FIRM|nr:type II toxin-antitoxin system RelE/ParE family toxin [Candidatus Limivivens intestinipullorum]